MLWTLFATLVALFGIRGLVVAGVLALRIARELGVQSSTPFVAYLSQLLFTEVVAIALCACILLRVPWTLYIAGALLAADWIVRSIVGIPAPEGLLIQIAAGILVLVYASVDRGNWAPWRRRDGNS